MRSLPLLMLLACAGGRSPSPAPAAAPFEGTVGIEAVTRRGPVRTVVDVRTGAHEGYDRVVFELDGGLPGYHVEYVDRPPHRCGSGDPVTLPGDGWLEVRLTPARMHTDQGAATITDRSRELGYANLVALESTCDFEAVVSWVLGLRSPEPYRVLELQDPPRLVIDVRHPGSSGLLGRALGDGVQDRAGEHFLAAGEDDPLLEPHMGGQALAEVGEQGRIFGQPSDQAPQRCVLGGELIGEGRLAGIPQAGDEQVVFGDEVGVDLRGEALHHVPGQAWGELAVPAGVAELPGQDQGGVVLGRQAAQAGIALHGR